MADIRIGVQPPTQVQVGTSLYPPVVVELPATHAEGDVDYFATAVLVDAGGAVVDGLLGGTKAASRFEVAGPRISVFPFTDLSITHPGTFVVRVDIYGFAYGGHAGAALIGQVETRPVAVRDAATPPENPCKPSFGLDGRGLDARADLHQQHPKRSC